MPRLFCFGYGFSAATLAHSLMNRGWDIAGTAREEAKRDRMRAEGIDPVKFDGTSPIADLEGALRGARHVLLSVPPGKEGDPVLAHHADYFRKHADRFEWVGYLSTTGVYGDRQGDWVDEDTAPAPLTPRGQARLKAEQDWLTLQQEAGLPVHIFRLAGIYGPIRNPFRSLRDGTARRIEKKGQVFSRIHVEDIAGILRASIDEPHPGRVYNVCDDEAAPPQDVITFAAELLNMEPPPLIPFEKAKMSEMGRSFYAECKRVRNNRVKEELDYTFKYPTYREGLMALQEAERF